MTKRDDVNRGNFPKWFEQRIIRAFAPGQSFGYAWQKAIDWLDAGFICDHCGTIDDKFVCEPYDPSEKMLIAVKRLAKRIDCWVEVVGTGSWHPGTTRIMFSM